VVEELANDAAQTVDARFLFTLPNLASLSRFALQRGGKWLDARVVDSDRIALVPRGPIAQARTAELPRHDDDELAMRIVDFAPKQRQKVLFAYDEATEKYPRREVYRYAISGPPCSVAPLRGFSVEVTLLGPPESFEAIETPNYPAQIRRATDRVIITFERSAFAPDRDFTVEFERRSRSPIEVQADAASHASFVLDLPEVSRAEGSAASRLPVRVVVLDKSYHQSSASIGFQRRLVSHLLGRATDAGRVHLLVCDSACSAWRVEGVTEAERAQRAGDLLHGLTPSGTFDLEGALAHAVALLEPGERAQVVYLGSGLVSAGTLQTATLVESSARLLARRDADLRVYGVGPERDEALLLRLASAASGTYTNLSEAIPSEWTGDEMLRALRSPKLTNVQLELPTGLVEPAPSHWPALVMGQEVRVTARVAAPVVGTIRLRGRLEGRDYQQTLPIALKGATARSPLVERWWARERLREVEQKSARGLFELGASELSRSAGVATRRSDWLLLESQRGRARGAFPERSWRGLASPPIWSPAPRDAEPTLRATSKVSSAAMTVLVAPEWSPERIAQQRRAIHSMSAQFRYCHERHTAGPSGWFEGRLDFMLRVDARGSFESLAAEVEPAADVRSLFACLRAVAAERRYGPSLTGPTELAFSVEFALDWSRGLRAHVPVPTSALSNQGAISTSVVAGDEQWRSATARAPSLAPLEEPTPARMIAGASKIADSAPRSLAALHLLGAVAGAHHERGLALAVLEAELALSPDLRELRQRAASAWLAAGDERRACAHLRALGTAGDDLTSLKARCRRRWLGEPVQPGAAERSESAAITERSLEKLDTSVTCQPFSVTVACEDSKRCPTPVVLTPEGGFISTQGRFPGNPLVFWPPSLGTYRILLIGEPLARGNVDLRVHLHTQRFAFRSTGAAQTVASVALGTEAPTEQSIGKPICGQPLGSSTGAVKTVPD
jgi:hypothetical protein